MCTQTKKMVYLHNHPKQGKASIVFADEFAQGQKVYYDTGSCVNTPRKVIELGLNSVIRRTRYMFLTENCQNFTNKVPT